MPPPCIDQWGNPCGQAAHPPAAGGVRAVALLSPITALCGTLGTLGAIEVCAPFGYGSVTSEATPPQYGNIPMPLGAAISMQSSTLSASTEDVRTSGRFRGWHYWQAFLVLAGGALVLSLLLSVLVLRGRPVSPRWLLRARRRRGVEAPP